MMCPAVVGCWTLSALQGFNVLAPEGINEFWFDQVDSLNHRNSSDLGINAHVC